jgi:hypothetical protein
MPAIPALGGEGGERQKQKNPEFEANLGYRGSRLGKKFKNCIFT